MAGDDDFRSPMARLKSQEGKLQRKEVWIFVGDVDISVDPSDEGRDDFFSSGMVMIHLLLHVNPSFEKTRPDITLESFRALNFCHGSCCLPPPNFKLEESISGYVESLSKEEILLVLSVNMRDSPLVLDDLNRLGESFDHKALFSYSLRRMEGNRQEPKN